MVMSSAGEVVARIPLQQRLLRTVSNGGVRSSAALKQQKREHLPFLGGVPPPGAPNMPLTPPDSPSSDDEEKNTKEERKKEEEEYASLSSSFSSSSSGGSEEDEDEEEYDEDEEDEGGGGGRAGGAYGGDVGGILIGAWTGEGPSSGTAPPAASDREREAVSANSRSGGSGRECRHHASGAEGDSGEKDPRSATVCVMQQKGGARPPMSSSLSDCSSSTQQQQQYTSSVSSVSSSSSSSSSCTMGGPAPPPPLRSALKRSGQPQRSSRSRGGLRVSINESKNEVVEADYVIVVRDDDEEPQLVSIRTFDLGGGGGRGGGALASSVDQVTLSPPEGYKDAFGHAVHETLDDSDTESQGVDVTQEWGIKVHDPDCPRANLPDVVTSQHCSSKSLTVENVRHHDQMMESGESTEGEEGKIAKTGILKGGKLWKNGGDNKKLQKMEADKSEKGDEPRRSVRFSGRDEYTTLETTSFDTIPFDMSNEAALACFLSPKFRELSELLGEQHGDWHVELSPIALENTISDLDSVPDGDIIHHPTCAKHKHKVEDQHQMDDEQISESVQRYDEMRRRIAAAEGRDNNSTCSDESKSSSDSQSSDSTTTESRIRRLENTDVAHVAGGIMRSNSEVRRAIERNALRRSLIKFAEARKKDTNKNDKNDKQESSLIEKLKWLTASEDATNGNANESVPHDDSDPSSQPKPEPEQDKPKLDESKINCTIEQYRRLAEMFNRTTSLRLNDISVPGDVREWKLESDLFPCEKIIADLENDELPPGTLTFTAVPAVSVCEQISDDESEKLIYSGGIRYTKEGTLPFQETQGSNAGLTVQRERSSFNPNSDSYTVEDIDEVLHDDRSSSVPSSSQSSPRLSGRSDVDGTSTAESGYSSNETNSELSQLLPPELDELAEFVKQDAGRMDRLRKRYDEPEDHGFCRRPSVRGIKPRFGSTTDLLKQMANQLIPPNVSQSSSVGSHMTWPYRDGEEESGKNHQQRRRVTGARSNTLPALQEDIPYATPPDTIYNQSHTNSVSPSAKSVEKHPRIVHAYSSTSDLRVPAPNRLSTDPSDSVRPVGQAPPQRAQSYTSIPQVSQYGTTQLSSSNQGGMSSSDQHLPTCISRRPASIHGHAPTDMLVSGPQHPTPRLIHTLSLQSYPRSHCQSQEDQGHVKNQSSHVSLAPRGSYPGIGSGVQYVLPNVIYDHHNNVPISYQHSSQPQVNPVEPPQSSTAPQNPANYSSQRLPNGHYERNYCPGWHGSDQKPNFVHNSHNIPPPIVSSQMSYTTPIVPDASNPRVPETAMVNGMLIKMEMERGVPEGASSSPRVILDSQYHPSSRETSLLHNHPPQAMNVST